jgi:NADH:ubiquinone oxidoreductase subunit E
MYDPSEKVSEGHNQHFHEAHKKKALHEIAKFDSDFHAKNLLHKTKSFFTKDTFGEENLLDMIPEQLAMTKTEMQNVVSKMYENLNYYYAITGPLHSHKTFMQQVE